MKQTIRLFLLIAGMLGLILFMINKIQNLSPALFSTTFYWEEGLDMEFRKNATYRAVNYDILERDVTYGRYKLQDSLIILLDKVKFGNSNMNDTLIATKKGIFFTMENPWRGVNEGTMSYVYGQTVKFPITNCTIHKIDSIFIRLSYTTDERKFRSVEPNKSIEYKFNMENPYVDGRYILSFRMLGASGGLKQIENITDGFPIETVKEIFIHENYTTTETFFGDKITREIYTLNIK